MKKNVFALSVAAALAGFAGVASAQVPFIQPATGTVAGLANIGTTELATEFRVNAGGIGHIQLVPYYSVQGPRNTLLNIVNTDTVNGKAVKVRFRGARNSDDVFDFYVFLSPGDVWRARVYRGGADFEQTFVELPDTSCTVPSREEVAATAFKTVRVFNDLETEVREGYIELLTAADIPPTLREAADGAATTTANPLYTTIKHNGLTGEVTCDAIRLANSTVNLTDLATARANGLEFPTNGLVAHWAITDVTTDTTVSGNATALVATNAAGAPARGSIVVAAQNSGRAPLSWTDVASANLGTTDPLLTTRAVEALNFDFPDLSTPYVISAPVLPATTPAAHQANEVSKALAVSAIVNEFTTGKGVDFRTDWVFSLPTRRYGVAIDYAAAAPGQLVRNAESAFFQPQAFGGDVRREVINGIPHLTIPVAGEYYDNNERTLTPEVSPGEAQRISGEVNVLTFNAGAADSVLGATISAQRVNPKLGLVGIEDGWARIALDNAAGPVAPTTAGYAGLPVIGYAALTAGGRALGFTWPHRFVGAN